MKENLVLIGMPGSGKSTIGRILGEKLGLPFIDLDVEIETHSNQSIPDLFEKGEDYFRDIESEVTEIFSKQSPLVIATGGGIILKESNIEELRQNGRIIFLNRSLENIAGDVEMGTRPLLKDGLDKLQKLYEERIDLYYKYADLVVDNNENPIKAIEQLMRKLSIEEKGHSI